MKQYNIKVQLKHFSKRHSVYIKSELENINNSFPILVEAKNKHSAQEIAETIIRDLNFNEKDFNYFIEIQWNFINIFLDGL